MATYTISDIEDAILAALEPLRASQGVRTLRSYEGELDDEKAIAQAITLFPAILSVYLGSQYTDHGQRKIERLSFGLFFGDRSLRAASKAAGLRGSATNPGVYALMDAARPLLYGLRLGLDISPIDYGRQAPEYVAKGTAVYSVEISLAQFHLYPGD